MEGFLRLRLPPWLRRLATRSLAIIPAAGVTILYGERETGHLLILTQVVLSMQLSFAVVPLVMFTSDRRRMGALVASSKIRMRGCVKRARAMATRWRWPPDSPEPCSPTTVS